MHETCYDWLRRIFGLVGRGTEFLPYKLPAYTPWWLCQPVFIFWPTPWWTDLNQKPSFLESRLFPLVLMSVAYNIGRCLHNQPSICPKSGPVEPSETSFGWIPLNFSSFIIVIFCHLFELLLVVQCCDIICEWPLTASN